MTQTSNIETNRLVLRPFSESDAPDVFESCDIGWMRNTGDKAS